MAMSRMLAAAAVATLICQAPALAQTACSDATVVGGYAAHGQGWIGTDGLLAPETLVAERYFDGKGHFTGSGHQTIGGVGRWFKTTGTYKVGPGCAITIDATSTVDGATTPSETVAHWYGVVIAFGNTIHATRTDRGFTTSTDFERVTPVY